MMRVSLFIHLCVAALYGFETCNEARGRVPIASDNHTGCGS